MATRILELNDYGYPGKTISLREPTGADLVAMNAFMIKDKKVNGEANTYMASLVLLSRVIEEAPFDKKVDTLEKLSSRLLNYLNVNVAEMMGPLPKEKEESY